MAKNLIRMVARTAGLVLLGGCAGVFESEIPESVTTAHGPNGNPADMMRHFGGVGPLDKGFGIHERLVDMGFNTYSYDFKGCWNFKTNGPAAGVKLDERMALRRTFFDRLHQDGVSVIDSIPGASDKRFSACYPRLYKDGTTDPASLDASDERAVRTAESLATWLGREAGHPAVIGAEPANEVRFRSHFSFTPEAIAAYRAYSGRDLPPEVRALANDKLRQPPSWQNLKDFPKDRVVPDDYPLLDFYRWCWKTGDGWSGYCTRVADAYRRGLGRDIFSMYSPALRTPAFWGTVGSLDLVRNWEYPYPEPYCLAYTAASLQAMARESDKMVIVSVQGISYRNRLAPKGIHLKDEPAWTKKYPNCDYPTPPPDLMREALWSVFARRTDGVATHGYDALLDVAKIFDQPANYDEGKGYRCANPETAYAMKEVFQQVGIPLGPLLRAVPERAPQVAVLASYASQILGGRITWNCQGSFYDAGVLAVAANLCPYAINEEEVATRGVPDSVKVLLLADCDVLTRSAYERIAAFARRGGYIVATDNLVPALKADAALPTVARAFAETASDHDDGKVTDVKDAAVRNRAVRHAAQALKAIAHRKMRPYADTDKEDIFVHVRSWKDADYVFPLNDKRTFGDYVGPWRRVQERGVPNAGVVTVDRSAGAVYDLVRHQAVPFESKDGRTTIPVSFDTSEGKALLVVSAPLGRLTTRVKGSRVEVRSPDRDVMLPIRVDGFGAKPFYGVMKDGAWTHDFGSLPTGTVRVTNLADGRTDPSLGAPKIAVFAKQIQEHAKRNGLTVRAAAEAFKAAGVSGFDCAYTEPDVPELIAGGLQPASFYGGMKYLAPDGGAAQTEAFVAAALKYKVPRVMMLPDEFTGNGDEADFEKIVAGTRRFVDRATACGLTVTTEDFGYYRTHQNPCGHVVYIRRLLDAVPKLMLTVDSGNLHKLEGRTAILDLTRTEINRIRHMHLKDFGPKGADGKHPYASLGTGEVPNREVLRLVNSTGYDGWYTLEDLVGDDFIADARRQIAFVREQRR